MDDNEKLLKTFVNEFMKLLSITKIKKISEQKQKYGYDNYLISLNKNSQSENITVYENTLPKSSFKGKSLSSLLRTDSNSINSARLYYGGLQPYYIVTF